MRGHLVFLFLFFGLVVPLSTGCTTGESAAGTDAPATVAGGNGSDTTVLGSPALAPGTSAPTPAAAPPAAPAPPLAVFICLDASGSYPAALLARARTTIADLVEQRIKSGHAGTRVGVRWITGASRSEEALLVDFEVGPVPPVPTRAVDPPPPAKPDLDDVAYRFNRAAREQAEQDWQAQMRAWEAEVGRNEAAHQAALAEQERALADAQAQMKAGTERIRTAPPPAATGSDVGGCIHAAARALARQPGERILIIASDLVPWGEQDFGELSLTGVDVRAAFYYCQRVSGCDEERRHWTPVFAAAGAASIAWYEPDEDVRTLLEN